MSSNPTGALVVRVGESGPFYEAKWRRRGRQVKRRVGGAWLTKDQDSGGWKPRRGRVPEGYFDEKRATVRMAELIAEHDVLEAEIERGERERNERGITVRELAAEWLQYVEREKGAKPSTLQEYRYLTAEPGAPHERGPGRFEGRIMKALGDRRIAQVTTREVAAFLRGLDRLHLSARNINEHRKVLSAMFAYACREDTYGLPRNPVSGTNKRREPPRRCSTSTSPRRSRRLRAPRRPASIDRRLLASCLPTSGSGANGRTARTPSFTAWPRIRASVWAS